MARRPESRVAQASSAIALTSSTVGANGDFSGTPEGTAAVLANAASAVEGTLWNDEDPVTFNLAAGSLYPLRFKEITAVTGDVIVLFN